MTAQRFDTVIVGGGTAGCVLAARLSEDAGRTVLLIEAGPAPHRMSEFAKDVLDGGVVAGARASAEYNWLVPGHLTDTRPYLATRGRILGGSSSTNGGYFVRPRLEDFAEWQRAGSAHWGFEAAMPRMRAMEHDHDFGATVVHGAAGPVPVTRTSVGGESTRQFMGAAAQLGFTHLPDLNDQTSAGVGPVPTNTLHGRQHNAAVTHLLPHLDRPNLTVWGRCVVERVVFDGVRASGVVVRRHVADETGVARDGVDTALVIEVVFAGEVVLAAGAIFTPQLLTLSGIGDAHDLARLGIPLVHHSPGVGRGLSDHPQLVVEWMPREPSAQLQGQWMGAALHTGAAGHELEVLQSTRSLAELVAGASSGATAGAAAGATTGTAPRATAVADTGGAALLVAACAPRRTGRIVVTSAEPTTPPTVDYGYLANADVRADLREAARLAARLTSATPIAQFAQWVGGPTVDDLHSDRSLDTWITAHLGSSQHTCATATFAGQTPVVDPEGRVLGVRGLRVADTSILPAAPRRGPALAAFLIGETIADAMRAG